ncbi:MAG: DUF1910 domain-containing protein [Lachnospiraceae bacterium]|nr:DUF1910 domain-containing protein [Lachnospiraceae bacterium]
MRDTVMNEQYLRNIFWKRQSELLIARYSSGEDIEKLENDFMQLLNDMPLYRNGNSSYIDMLWMMALAILFDVSREKAVEKLKEYLEKYWFVGQLYIT